MTTAPQTMAGVDILSTEYLLAGLPRIPRGDVCLLFGDGAVGKGRLIWAWIAEVINSDPDAVVLGIWPEDHPNEQIAPRLRDAGVSDPSRVVNMTRLPNGSRFKLSADLTHAGDLGLLRQFIADIADTGRKVKMIVLDPLASVVGWGSIQTNAGARRLLEPVQDLCMDTGIAGVVVAHTVTGGKLQGSMGLSQAARFVYRVSLDRVNPAVRVISVDKANNLPETEDLRFVIEGDDAGHVRVVMLDGAESDRRQRQWREPRQAPPVAGPFAGPPPAAAPAKHDRGGLHSVPDLPGRIPVPASAMARKEQTSALNDARCRPPATRPALITGILSVECPDCHALGGGMRCSTQLPGSGLVPLSMDPVIAVHAARALDAWAAGRITESDVDTVLAAVA